MTDQQGAAAGADQQRVGALRLLGHAGGFDTWAAVAGLLDRFRQSGGTAGRAATTAER